jgi:exopolysaccharide production protein ExoQ
MSAWDQTAAPPRYRRIRGGDEDFVPRRRTPPSKGPKAHPAQFDDEAAEPGFLDWDGVFAFAVFTPMLFIAQINTWGAAAVAGLAPLYLFFRRERLFKVLAPRAFLFLVPALALFSVVWSEAAGESFRYAAEYLITVIVGLLLSSAQRPGAVLKGLALAFLLYVTVSVAMGGTVLIGVGAGGAAFSGLSESKNLLADIASTGLIVSAALCLIAIQRRSWPWLLIGLFAIALDTYAVVAARSAGALLGLAMAIMAIAGLTPLVFAGRIVRAWVTSMVGVILLAVGLSYRWLAAAMIEMGASIFDKDPTLTGRTYLWYRAADLIREKPFLGRGYYAFWLQGNTDAEGLWRYFGIDNRGGFTFHNTLVDILVTLGWAGAVVIVGVAVVGVIALIRRFVSRPSLSLVFWIAILLYQLARTPIETIGIAPFYFSTVLTFGALGAAFGRARVPKPIRAAHPQMRQLKAWTVEGAQTGWANPRMAPARGALRLLAPEPPAAKAEAPR